MGLECLKVDSCTVLWLSQTTMDNAPLAEQVEPYLAQNSNLGLDAHGLSFNSMEIGELVNLAGDFHKSVGRKGLPHGDCELVAFRAIRFRGVQT